ncbi:Uncharacterised protein [Vibrio cholerae]|nr:Uncharacterised protein [Vibrio cholerae]CSI59759.1 Uncharacterised protein [Vibrio cholerae]
MGRARLHPLQQSRHNLQESQREAAQCLVSSPWYLLNLVNVISESNAAQLAPLADPHLYGSIDAFR